MSRKDRVHIVNDEAKGDDTAPRNLSKEEFGRRLYRLMIGRGWRQSDLARHSGLPRDAVSTYIRARSYPTPVNLAKLAAAFEMEPGDLLPNTTRDAIADDRVSLELKVSPADETRAWLKVDREVSFDIGSRVLALLSEDVAARK